MIEKKAIQFPLWLEAVIVLGLLLMAVVEYLHDQWFWAVIFGAAGVCFGMSIIARFGSGEKNGRR